MNLSDIQKDRELWDELISVLNPRGPRGRTWGIVGGGMASRYSPKDLKAALESPEVALVPGDEREAIIREFLRPVLIVRRSSYDLEEMDEPDSQVWRARLGDARVGLESALPAVGRVEVRNHPRLDWVGTAWLAGSELTVTNRHVADEFAWKGPDGSFHPCPGSNWELIRASVNFLGEYQVDEESEHRVEAVVHAEPPDGPDVALMRLRGTSALGDSLSAPIPLASDPPLPGQFVAVIGYPAEDGRRNDPLVMDRLFRGVFGCKRLAPGQVLSVDGPVFTYDCTTLGGNSGSVVVELATGRALGIHYGGRYGRANYAVRCDWLLQKMSELGLRG